VGGKESGYVLNEEPSSVPHKVIGDSGELEEQAGSLACEPPSSSGDGEVLAWEAAAEEVKTIGIALC
jgi:hypothetical protein